MIIIGGDGTIHHIVQAFKKKPEHYLKPELLPGGTVNNLAKRTWNPL